MKGTYRKDELLDIIRRNRETHRAVFMAAMDGYADQAMKILEEALEQMRQGRRKELRILLARPEDHTRDYDRAIRMLEMEVRDEVELTEEQFAQLIMDDFEWKRSWVRRMSSYASASTRQAYGDEAIEDE